MTNKLLARIGLAKKTCSNCKSFDLEKGQREVMQANTPFAAAAQVLSPADMYAVARSEEEIALEKQHVLDTEAALAEGKTPPPLPELLVEASKREPPDKTAGGQWTEYGACAKRPDEAVWSGWCCEDWG